MRSYWEAGAGWILMALVIGLGVRELLWERLARHERLIVWRRDWWAVALIAAATGEGVSPGAPRPLLERASKAAFGACCLLLLVLAWGGREMARRRGPDGAPGDGNPPGPTGA